MDIPAKVKIGGHWYEIKYPYKYQERYDRGGHCDFSQKIICVGNDDGNGNLKADSAIIVTFIHEILHAIDNLTGHEMFLGSEGESRVEALSEGIYQFLVDNGYLTLKEEGKKNERQLEASVKRDAL